MCKHNHIYNNTKTTPIQEIVKILNRSGERKFAKFFYTGQTYVCYSL